MNSKTGKAASDLTDNQLLELVQRRTFRFFWELGHPKSGLARDRVSGPPDLVTIGGSGFAVMAIIVATERGWIRRNEAITRLGRMTAHLERAASYHGVFPTS